MKKAIATMAIGERYRTAWRTTVEPNWRRYAQRHGYDIVCFEEPLDESDRARSRSPAWQKLLILGREELASHDVVVWVDADICINIHRAPCIVASRKTGNIGLCQEMTLPDVPLFSLFNERIERLQRSVRLRHGVDPDADRYRRHGLENPGILFNTGVMVFDRNVHRTLLERVYDQYDYKGPGRHFEMGPLSYEIAAEEAYEVLDPKFNVLFLPFVQAFARVADSPNPILNGRIALLGAVFSASYFLHFAGIGVPVNDLRFLDLDRDPARLRPGRLAQALRNELASGKLGPFAGPPAGGGGADPQR